MTRYDFSIGIQKMTGSNNEDTQGNQRPGEISKCGEIAGGNTRHYLKRKLLRSSRRRFLKRMSQLGISGATLRYFSKNALAGSVDDPQNQVPRLKGWEYKQKVADPSNRDGPPEREATYYSIPKSEWILRACTRSAADQFAARWDEKNIGFGITNKDGGLSILAQYSTYERADGSNDSPQISYEEMKQRLPTSTTGEVRRNGKRHKVENIQILPRKVKYVPQTFEEEYSPVPGGCHMQNESYNGCTLAFPSYDNDEDEYCHTTAAHCINREFNEEVGQPYQTRIIGDSDDYSLSGDGDVAEIEMDSDNDVIFDIAAEENDTQNSEGWLIAGTYAADQLDDMVADGDSAYLQGGTTGRTQGTVLAHFDQSASSGPKVRLDVNSDHGDSGGAYYNLEYGTGGSVYSYRIGIHAWESGPNQDQAAGNTFYYAEDELNLS